MCGDNLSLKDVLDAAGNPNRFALLNCALLDDAGEIGIP